VVELCWKALTDAAGHTGEQRVRQQLALLRYQASAHAGLAVLAGHVALDRDIDGGAIARHAGQ
jgi:hypothetical protein